ncbi:MAG TPA: hypothetical protein VFI22_18330, partial [Thermomicrobiales bacterium]|nr:hypothetical protein [Thermomicrobiales bacterium]
MSSPETTNAASTKAREPRPFVVTAQTGDEREELDYWTSREAISNARDMTESFAAETIRVV